ncbi:MAG: hypothetical protein D4R56_00155 [Deltaproteobacteria bacterium]|nr:MAG: hypothetical protein D4R56_00155 [Deltaproteobacteria bacterium]
MPRLIRRLILFIGFVLLLPAAGLAEEFYRFDISEIEKKPYHFGGYVELRPVAYGLDRDSALYKLQYYDQNRGATLEEWNARLQLEGSYQKGMGRLYLKTNTDYRYASFTGGVERTALFEGYGTLKPSDSWKFEIGKKNLKWGKGYAWNPVNFLDRAKDPNDPEQSIEGNIMATMDYIRSFDGPLKTLSFTPVLFPVYDHMNDGFGVNNRLNVGGKVYLLLYDTDLDLIYVVDGSRTARMGMDFSRNITTSFEIHGELAHIRDDRKQVLDADGVVHSETRDAVSGLIGVRHLTTFDLTTIFEYYHNGTGFSADAMENYFGFIERGYELYRTTGSARMLTGAQNLAAGGYGRNNPMEDYLYLRLSQKEPLDILYFTPSLTTMVNLNDRSYSITPELLYTGITNLELRLRFGWIRGGRETEFGEKPNDYRLELRAGYYF